MNSPILQLKDIAKHYNTPGSDTQYCVFDHINLEVFSGDMLGIVGPSGSGKSTLLNIIGALDLPTAGTVVLDDQDITALDQEALAKIRNQKIGFVFQLHHLLPQCTLLDNVLLPYLSGFNTTDQREVKDFALELLSRIGLVDRKDHYPFQLSGGQRQRAAFVRALINRPKIVLADEPTGSLDQENAQQLMALMVKINKELGTTLIVVSHWEKMNRYLDTTIKLADGTLT
jgi:ABC-type lipoprotein export system ATPase subunit